MATKTTDQVCFLMTSLWTPRDLSKHVQSTLRRTPLGPALGVRLIESQIKGVKKGNSKSLFYRDVRHIEVSIKRE